MIQLVDDSRNYHPVMVNFVDTLALTPGGKGLAECGRLIGKDKVEIPSEYSIDNMRQYLEDDPEGFENYAITDAVIAVLYAVKFKEILLKEFDIKHRIYSIAQAGVQYFKKLIEAGPHCLSGLMGVEQVSTPYWDEHLHKLSHKKINEINKYRKIFEMFTTDCYLGGRNEAFTMGPTLHGQYDDWDLSGAYTHAMVGLLSIDYKGVEFIKDDITPFLEDVLGFAHVAFSFPEGTRYPCLPVPTHKHGLIYPLEGESFCTANEIAVAHQMSAKMTLDFGIIIPWLTNPDHGDQDRTFLEFVRKVKEMRKKYAKGSLEEQLWKAIGNSLYGKTGQGLKEKRVFDTHSGLTKSIPHSAISNPYIAAYTTGFCRAVVSELMAKIPDNRTIYSVTTDGFITDAIECELDLSGPISQRFQQCCDLVSGQKGTPILELKHRVNRLNVMKTRGQTTLEVSSTGDILLAKAGVKPPVPPIDHNDYMNHLYFNRYPGQMVLSDQFLSLREQFIGATDLTHIKREKLLNLEPDFKRQLINPRMIDTHLGSHLAMDSKPWKTMEEAGKARAIFNGWRKQNTLKTLEDWELWYGHYLVRLSAPKGSGIKVKGNKPDLLFWKVLERVFVHKACGLEQHQLTYAEISAYLLTLGYSVNVSTLKNGKRAKLPYQVVPAIPETLKLLVRILDDYPQLDWRQIFVADQHELVEEALSS